MIEIALYKALVEAGASEEAARESRAWFTAPGENATKADIAAVGTRLTRWVVITGGIYTAILFSLLKLL